MTVEYNLLFFCIIEPHNLKRNVNSSFVIKVISLICEKDIHTNS